MRIAIIGGGAAGFFAALSAKEHDPRAEVHLYEKSDKVLAKVKVSGGGRCNVTHHCPEIRQFASNYPRGERFMRTALREFSSQDVVRWFQSRGVLLKVEDDHRMFPVSNRSQSIIDVLMDGMIRSGVRLSMHAAVMQVAPGGTGFELTLNSGEAQSFDRVIIATGGSPKRTGLKWIEDLGHTVVEPLPSLFTFNMPENPICTLMGVSVSSAEVRIIGTDIGAIGPVLITHWGMSGPAVLKTSAFGARLLAERSYIFECAINWVGGMKEHLLRAMIEKEMPTLGPRKMKNRNPFDIPSRLWEFLLAKSEIDSEKEWRELTKKALNKLINHLVCDIYSVSGKTTFKEEFVTAGGVSLERVNPTTMESEVIPGLYFAGEVLDIDGVTGGFNFQAAWTTGYLAGKHAVLSGR